MDLRNYYQKIRQVEAEIGEDPTIVMSLETSDGGKAGRATEVPRETAARLIVELRARLATAEEAAAYRALVEEQRRIADQVQAMSRTQFAVISDVEMKAIRGALKPSKG